MGANSSSRIEIEQRFLGLRAASSANTSQKQEDITPLANNRNKILEKSFWEPIWLSSPTLTLEELNNFIDSTFIFNLLVNFPECLHYLVNQCVVQLEISSTELRKVCGTENADAQVTSTLANTITEYSNRISNSANLISRILPFIFQFQYLRDSNSNSSSSIPNIPDLSNWIDSLFWATNSNSNSPSSGKEEITSKAPSSTSTSNTSSTSTSNTSSTSTSNTSSTSTSNNSSSSTSLGGRLVDVLISLCFLPGYTIPQDIRNTYNSSPVTAIGQSYSSYLIPLRYIWSKGIGVHVTELLSGGTGTVTYPMINNRICILRSLISCFSSILYVGHSTIPQKQEEELVENKLLHYMTSVPNVASAALFYSLINYSFNYDPIGWGIPYNYVVSIGSNDSEEELASLCLQILSILTHTNFYSLSTGISSDSKLNANSNSNTKRMNVYVNYLKEIKKKEDMEWITKNIIRLINNPIIANRTYLPNSTKQITFNQEILLILFSLLQENTVYLSFICNNDLILNIVNPILHIIYDGRKESSKLGVVHICAFILLILSGEREYGVLMNRDCNSKIVSLPKNNSIYAAVFNYADYLIFIFHLLFVDSHSMLADLHECLLTIIANISPYIKTMSMTSCMNLLKLFEMVTKINFLFANSRNNRFCFFLLETFSNLIEYQYEGNTKLAYSILSKQDLFFKLANLSINMIPTNDSNPKKFVPTEEWLQSWKSQLPIGRLLHMIQIIKPQIKNLVTGNATDEEQILKYLKNTTLVGLLPVPHPIVTRKYQPNAGTESWITTYIWGVVYSRNYPLLFYGVFVKLFPVPHITQSATNHPIANNPSQSPSQQSNVTPQSKPNA